MKGTPHPSCNDPAAAANLPLEERGICANSRATPPATLERLAGDADFRVRLNVAANPSAPAATLERLAGDGKWIVRRGVAHNLAAPKATLKRLARDADYDVLRVAEDALEWQKLVREARRAEATLDLHKWKKFRKMRTPRQSKERRLRRR